MNIDELIKLYILQKDHHLNPSADKTKLAFENYYDQLLVQSNIAVKTTVMMADPIFNNQPNIPFVLLTTPTDSSSQQLRKKPLIVHVHGGPEVYVDEDIRHAEIAYFLSKGFTVACVNYRGSSSHPVTYKKQLNGEIFSTELDALDIWDMWKKKSINNHHIYGPEDVYTVALYMTKMNYIDPANIFLRGGSFGSHINSHLLAGINQGTYKNIFKGVHLSGGIKYAIPSTMPTNIPMLITHGQKDPICTFPQAKFFMQKTILHRLSSYDNKQKYHQIEIYCAPNGNHHLIDPDLMIEDISKESYNELKTYLELTTNFIMQLYRKDYYQPRFESFEQLSSISDNPIIATKLLNSVRYVKEFYSITPRTNLHNNINPARIISYRTNQHFGPTKALLKLYLKNAYTGNTNTDLKTMLSNLPDPNKFTQSGKEIDAGKRILEDTKFFEQMVEMVETEEEYLKENPDKMVLYHTTINDALFIYIFINIWRSILEGYMPEKLDTIYHMRLYDFITKSFASIDDFLEVMLKRKTNYCFNNTEGFADRAIACNPSLISNFHSTASCSLWWYFSYKDSRLNDNKMINIIESFLKILGLESPERIARYQVLFTQCTGANNEQPLALMQQMFVPYELAEKSAYMCQIWGTELNSQNLELTSPAIVRKLIEDPESLETFLRKNSNVFTNLENDEKFGKTVEEGFTFSGLLQTRYLYNQKDHKVDVKSYCRSNTQYNYLVGCLSVLIQEDFAEYLANDILLSSAIMPNAEKTKLLFLHNDRYLQHSQFMLKASQETLYLQQCEMRKGLVPNYSRDHYKDLKNLDSQTKLKLQERIKTTVGIGENNLCLFALCRYLKGYTYYDIINEAIHNYYTNKTITLFEQQKKEQIVKIIESFSDPTSIDTVSISGESYRDLKVALDFYINHYRYDQDKHFFMQYDNHPIVYPQDLFNLEIGMAKEYILRHARLAKEKFYGHDISARKKRLLY